MEYRREIDGLRALAVLPVILFHAGFSWFSGGYVGVDIFFVISGYLITTIIINDLENDDFSIAKFYEKRARRILPALFFIMLCCIPFAWAWMVPTQLKDFSQSLVAISLFLSNVFFWRKEDYFARAAEENPLLHTWSLAVEEQFYIFFPILLLLLWRFGKNPVFYVVLVITALSLALSEWGWRNYPSANFYLMPTRAWELGAGAICAFLLNKKNFESNNILSISGLVMVVFSIVFFDEHTPFPSLYAAVPVAGAALIVIYGGKDSIVGRWLSVGPLVWIGLISYSAYLWHQPLIAFSRIKAGVEPSGSIMILVVILAVLLAYLSWKYVEQPFRKKSLFSLNLTRSKIFATSAVFLSVFVSVGVYGHMSNGLFENWKARFPNKAYTYELITRERETKIIGPELEYCQFRSLEFDDDTISRVQDCGNKYGPAVMVLGDSHAIDFFNGLVLNEYSPFIIGAVSGGCRPHTPLPGCQYENVKYFLSTYPGLVSHVFYTQAGFHLLYREDGWSEVTGRAVFSDIDSSGKIDVDSVHPISAYVERVSEYLEDLSQYTSITWIGPRIEPHIGNSEIVRRGCSSDFTLREGQSYIFQSLGEFIEDYSYGLKFSYLDQIEKSGFDIRKDFMNCNNSMWSDGDHWSLPGAKEFVSRLMD